MITYPMWADLFIQGVYLYWTFRYGYFPVKESKEYTISYKFCFQTTTDGEAERMCEYMDLEATQENKEGFEESEKWGMSFPGS